MKLGGGYNFLLEGDNLHSLYLLEKTHKGKIDLIYIDPPYNTGNKDFFYHDSWINSDDEYLHSKWLSFMEKRLKVAKNLLSARGMIFISINDNEAAGLKLLCDSIFNEKNFVNILAVEMSPSSGVKRAHKDKGYIKNKEFVFVYSNSKVLLSPLYDEWDKYDNHYSIYFDGQIYIPLLEIIKSNFTDYKKINYKQYFFYEEVKKFIVENSSKIYRTHEPSKWALQNVNNGITLFENDKIIVKKVDNPSNINEFELLKSKNGKTSYDRLEPLEWNVFDNKICTLRGDLWLDFDKDMGNVSKEGDVKFPNGKKPIRLLKDIVKSATNKDSVVLDFFAGSGSTGHAVLELNNEDNGNRKFILCTNNENGICENITFKRMINVLNGYKNIEGISFNLKYYQTELIPKNSSNVTKRVMEHVKELIELEWGVNIDKKEHIMVLTEDQLDRIEEKWDKLKTTVKSIYRARQVVYTGKQKELFKNINNYIIPDYYFDNELKEVGENW